jgi:O-antigen/teichoic acid export membrane protein
MNFANKSFSLLQRDIFLLITNLVTGIVVARELGPTMMGLWVVLLLIPGYAEAFGRLKFDAAAVYFLGKKRTSIGEMVFILNILALLTSTVILFIFIWQFDWFYTILFHTNPTDMRFLTYFILLVIPLQFIYLNYSYLHIFSENVRVYNRMQVIDALLSSSAGIAMLFILNLGIFGILLGKVMGLLVSIIYSAYELAKVEKMKPSLKIDLIIELAKYSSHFYIGGIISHLHIYLTNLLAALYLAPAQVAFFSMGKGRCEMLTRIVPNAIGTLLFPRVSKSEDIKQSRDLTARAFRLTFLILLISGGILAAIIKPMVYILYGKDYLPLITPFWIVLPGLVYSQSTSVFTSYFSGIGRADLIPKITILPLIIQVLVAYYFIPLMGIVGASIAFLISTTSVAIIQTIVFLKLSHCPLQGILLQKTDFYILKEFITVQFGNIKVLYR